MVFRTFFHTLNCCLFLCLALNCKLEAIEKSNKYITYDFSGGRFGDNLLAYLHAKWISYSNEIPLIYRPFCYSSSLQLHDVEIPESSAITALEFVQLSNTTETKATQTLYICPYFPESQWERLKTKGPHGGKWPYFEVNWRDPKFREIVRKMISPKNECLLIRPPQEKISIAIHVRNGGGFDMSDAGLRNPTKFPPLDFYTKALQKVIALFEGFEMYCFVFTDAIHPAEIVEEMKKAIPSHTSIKFDFRSENNRHDLNVLEDFYSLFQFDVLIHAESNFSLIPTLLQDYAIVCHPVSGYSQGDKITIDLVSFKIDELVYEKVRKKCL